MCCVAADFLVLAVAVVLLFRSTVAAVAAVAAAAVVAVCAGGADVLPASVAPQFAWYATGPSFLPDSLTRARCLHHLRNVSAVLFGCRVGCA